MIALATFAPGSRLNYTLSIPVLKNTSTPAGGQQTSQSPESSSPARRRDEPLVTKGLEVIVI